VLVSPCTSTSPGRWLAELLAQPLQGRAGDVGEVWRGAIRAMGGGGVGGFGGVLGVGVGGGGGVAVGRTRPNSYIHVAHHFACWPVSTNPVRKVQPPEKPGSLGAKFDRFRPGAQHDRDQRWRGRSKGHGGGEKSLKMRSRLPQAPRASDGSNPVE